MGVLQTKSINLLFVVHDVVYDIYSRFAVQLMLFVYGKIIPLALFAPEGV